jgi:hypothetical protein
VVAVGVVAGDPAELVAGGLGGLLVVCIGLFRGGVAGQGCEFQQRARGGRAIQTSVGDDGAVVVVPDSSRLSWCAGTSRSCRAVRSGRLPNSRYASRSAAGSSAPIRSSAARQASRLTPSPGTSGVVHSAANRRMNSHAWRRSPTPPLSAWPASNPPAMLASLSSAYDSSIASTPRERAEPVS